MLSPETEPRSSGAPAKRAYRSPRRERRAQATRQRITAVARRLFARRGYAATSIEAIAEDAGVAVATVYAAMRSKRAILLALLDTIEHEAGVAQLADDLEAARADPLRQLEVVIDLDCRLFEENLDVLEILRAARAADPRLTPIWREGGRRRRRGQARLVRSWAEAKLLAPGLGQRQAADILWALTGPDVYRLFVFESRWRTARFRRWLRGALASLLFEPGWPSITQSRGAARPRRAKSSTKPRHAAADSLPQHSWASSCLRPSDRTPTAARTGNPTTRPAPRTRSARASR
jgi:AcrR family transcriptional regulator